jgi:hypothetical protein
MLVFQILCIDTGIHIEWAVPISKQDKTHYTNSADKRTGDQHNLLTG